MHVGGGIVGDVPDVAIQPNQETDTTGHVFAIGHAGAIGVGDFAVGIDEQREIQIIFGDELLMAGGGIATDADNSNVLKPSRRIAPGRLKDAASTGDLGRADAVKAQRLLAGAGVGELVLARGIFNGRTQ